MDPLFVKEEDRFTVLPIRYQKIWDSYKLQESCIWHVSEIAMSGDFADWQKLNEQEKHFLEMVLAFFAASDKVVMENIDANFSTDIKVMEANMAYGFQKTMEGFHAEMYSVLIQTYVPDLAKQEFLLNAVKTIPIISKMAAWAYKWMNKDIPFEERLIAFSAYEGVLFSGPFCSIYWVKERGLLPGLSASNDFIARDEGMHVDFANLLHSMLLKKCPTEKIHTIFKEAVDLEIEFITEALPCSLIGMNQANMKEYIMYVANRQIKELGCPELYPSASQPFTFMDRICLSSKKNFFEKVPNEYKKKQTSTVDAYDGI